MNLGILNNGTLFPNVGINNPPVPKTDTQETENLDKAISPDQESTSMCSLLLSKHKMADSGSSLHP
jgi:hypothetical protein